MASSISFAAFLAVAGFIVGLIGSLFADATLGERLLIAAAAAATTFLAAILLIADDDRIYREAFRTVRATLLARDDADERTLRSHDADADPALILQTRQAIARFFDVPESKVYPRDDLRRDLTFDSFSWELPFFVLGFVCSERQIEDQPFVIIQVDALTDVVSLAAEVQRVLDDAARRSRSDDAQRFSAES